MPGMPCMNSRTMPCVQPVSTMTQWSIQCFTEARHRVITGASSFTIMFRQMRSGANDCSAWLKIDFVRVRMAAVAPLIGSRRRL